MGCHCFVCSRELRGVSQCQWCGAAYYAAQKASNRSNNNTNIDLLNIIKQKSRLDNSINKVNYKRLCLNCLKKSDEDENICCYSCKRPTNIIIRYDDMENVVFLTELLSWLSSMPRCGACNQETLTNNCGCNNMDLLNNSCKFAGKKK
jgi:hypothetical protein